MIVHLVPKFQQLAGTDPRVNTPILVAGISVIIGKKYHLLLVQVVQLTITTRDTHALVVNVQELLHAVEDEEIDKVNTTGVDLEIGNKVFKK